MFHIKKTLDSYNWILTRYTRDAFYSKRNNNLISMWNNIPKKKAIKLILKDTKLIIKYMNRLNLKYSVSLSSACRPKLNQTFVWFVCRDSFLNKTSCLQSPIFLLQSNQLSSATRRLHIRQSSHNKSSVLALSFSPPTSYSFYMAGTNVSWRILSWYKTLVKVSDFIQVTRVTYTSEPELSSV